MGSLIKHLCIKLLTKLYPLTHIKSSSNRNIETIIKIVFQLYLLKSKDNVADNYDNDKRRVHYSYHSSQFDTALLNKALEKSIKDKEFLHSSLNLLKNARFPMYRDKIIEHVRKFTNDNTTIALFYTLSDSLEFKDINQIKNLLQSNIIAKNSPSSTKNPDELNVNPLTTKQNQNSPTSDSNESLSSDAMREYTCNRCGKSFLTRDELHVHQKFEG